MTPKEKAKELVDRFKEHSQSHIDDNVAKEFNSRNIEYTKSKFAAMMRWSRVYNAKECALICVDEMIKVLWKIQHSICSDEIIYLEEVKQEIEKI